MGFFWKSKYEKMSDLNFDKPHPSNILKKIYIVKQIQIKIKELCDE